MKRFTSTFVVLLSLLALCVSSAACLALPFTPGMTAAATHHHGAMEMAQGMGSSMDMAMEMPMASAPGHACCASQAATTQLEGACCTVHHEPANTNGSDTTDTPLAFSAVVSSPVPFVASPLAAPAVAHHAPPAPQHTLQLRI